jgi:hypothetical protein
MKIEIHSITEMSIEAFANIHGLTMEVHERNVKADSHARYYAHFKGVEVKVSPGILGSTYGNGKTPKAAIAEYAMRISLQCIVVDAMRESRREIDVPRLID